MGNIMEKLQHISDKNTRIKLSFVALLIILFCLFMARTSTAQTTWTGNGDGTTWSDGANWNNGIPGSSNGFHAIFSNVSVAVTGIGVFDTPDILEIINNASVILHDNIEIYDRLFVASGSSLNTSNVDIVFTNEYYQLTYLQNEGTVDFSDASVVLSSKSTGGGRDPVLPGVVEMRSFSEIPIKNLLLESSTTSGSFVLEGLDTDVFYNITGTFEKISAINLTLDNADLRYIDTQSKLKYAAGSKEIGAEWVTGNYAPHNVTIDLNSASAYVSSSSGRAINGTLNLSQGVLDLGSNTMQVRGSIEGSQVAGNGTIHNNTILFLGCMTQDAVYQEITGNIKLNKLRINKTNGINDEANTVRLGGSAQITFESSGGFVRVENGNLDLNGRPINNRENAELEIQSGGKLHTGGSDIRNFNNYELVNGTIEYSGNAGETIDGYSEIATLIINNTDQGVTISTSITVTNLLNLQNGVLNTGSNAITISVGSAINGGSSASFINGKLRRAYDEAGNKSFPVGVAGRFRPAEFNYTSFTSGGDNSIIEIEYSIQGFTPMASPSGIGEISAEGHYLIREKGTEPSSFEYNFTGNYSDITLEPAENLRLLIESSSGYVFEPGQAVDDFANSITVMGLTALPNQSGTPRVVFGLSGGLIFFTDNGATSSWFEEANWSGGFLPGSADEVEIKDYDVEIGAGSRIEISALQLKGTARLSITSGNTTDRALVIGSGSGSETVLFIEEFAELVVNGGSGKAVSIHPSGEEKIEVFGKLTLQSSDGLGSGSSSLAGSRTLFHAGSLYQHFIDASFWQPAAEYGTLEINTASSKTINTDMLIHNNLTMDQIAINFASGSSMDKRLEIRENLTINSGASLNISNIDNYNTLSLHGNVFTDGGQLQLDNRKVNLEFAGADEQTIPSFITEVGRLTTDGGIKNLEGDITILDELNVVSGILEAKGNIITIGNSESMGSVAGGNGFVIGTVRRHIHSGNTDALLFPLGNREDEIVTHNRPVQVTFGDSGPSGNGTLTAQFITETPEKAGLPLEEDDLKIENVGISGYWQILEDGLGSFTYDIEVEARNFVGIHNLANIRLLKRDDNSSPWELAGEHGTVSGTTEEPVITRQNISSFSEFAIGGDSENTLPVELTYFGMSETSSSSHATLKWTTATEIENYGFEVFRKKTGQEWKRLDFVQGQGTVQQRTDYSYEDHALNTAGTYEYRIVQIDYDGTRTEFESITFTFEAPSSIRMMANYPNPFNPTTVIPFTISDHTNVQIAVYDMLGRRVQILLNESMQPGRYEARFDARQLSSGMYMVRMVADGHSQTMNITLVK